MTDEDYRLNDAVKSRITIENAIKIIFPDSGSKITKAIKTLKKEFNISKEEQDLVESIWKTSSAILHGENEILLEDDVLKASKILRNILKKENDFKKEYSINGLIYYKLVNNGELSYNNIFILKAYFESLDENIKPIEFMLMSEQTNEFYMYLQFRTKGTFDVNKLALDSRYSNPSDYHINMQNDIFYETIIDIECNDTKNTVSNEDVKSIFKEYKIDNLIYYKLNRAKSSKNQWYADDKFEKQEELFILKQYFNILEDKIKVLKVEISLPNNELKYYSTDYVLIKKSLDNNIFIKRKNNNGSLMHHFSYINIGKGNEQEEWLNEHGTVYRIEER